MAGWPNHQERILSDTLNAWLTSHTFRKEGPGKTDFAKKNLSTFPSLNAEVLITSGACECLLFHNL